MRLLPLLFNIALFAGIATATIIHVPDDYSTIQTGINASLDGDTVLVQPDLYQETINFNGHNIVLGSLFLMTSDTTQIPLTIIDGNNSNSTVSFTDNEDSTAIIIGFTIQHGLSFEGGGITCINSHPKILDNIIKENIANSGGGIYCSGSQAYIAHNNIHHNTFLSPLGNPGGGICCDNSSNAVIIDNFIHDNQNQDGAGIAVVNSNPIISHNVIFDNHAFDLGGGIRSDYSTPTLINNTITQNSASEGGGLWCLSSVPIIVNTIFWDNTATISGNEIIGLPVITYSDIRGGYVGEGNLNDNPLFVASEQNNFHLQEGSPCIDTGDPNSPLNPDSTRADIGAYYHHQNTWIASNNSLHIPNTIQLFQNFPNPFNPTTTISYAIPFAGHASLQIYNITGQLVATMTNSWHHVGTYSQTFNASGLASGIYFYRLQVGEFSATGKMVLLK